MSPVLMDEEPYSTGSSVSAGENCSNTTGSDQEGELPQEDTSGMKRREQNRDAARKTRKKQTERADELHQELQREEQAKSALLKEITALKKEAQHYNRILQNHEPHCTLRASSSAFSSAASCSVKDQLQSTPHQFIVQTLDSPSAATIAASTSSFSCKNSNFASFNSTVAKLSSISSELTSSSSLTGPVALPCSPASSLQSSDSTEPSVISVLAEAIPKTDFMSGNAYCCNTVALDESSMKQTSKSKVVAAHDTSVHFPAQKSGNLNIGGPVTPHSNLPTPTILSQTNLFPIPPISLKPPLKEQWSPGPPFYSAPALPNAFEKNTGGSQGLVDQEPLPRPTVTDPSFSEFLEGNDWILSESNIV